MTSILATTGILDSEDAQAADDVANTAVSAAMAFVSCSAGEAVTCLQGVSGVVSGLSSLFGGDSGPSASDQLLEGQRRLLEGQRILMEGQRALLEGQLAARQQLRAAHQDVLKNRIALLEATDAIDRRMAAGFEDVQRALGVQLWEIGQLVDVMREFSEFGTQLENCQSFLDVRRAYDSFEERVAYVPETLDRAFSVGEFSTWRDLQAHFGTYRRGWMDCLSTARNVFSSRQIGRDLHSVFRLSIYRGRTSGGTLLTDYVNPGFAPLIRFLSRHYSVGADQAGMRTFCALLNSPLSHAGIDMRGVTMFQKEPCTGTETNDAFNTLWVRNGASHILAPDAWLLHPDVLVELSYLMMEALPYYQMTDEQGELLDVDGVAVGVSGRPEDEDRTLETQLVETAYRLVSIGIAQQVLMSGDIFLPLVNRYLFSENVRPSERNEMVDVLGHNPMLARNWLLMEVSRNLRLGANTPTAFAENMELYKRIFESRAAGDADRALPERGYEQLFPSYWLHPTAAAAAPAAFAATGNELLVFKEARAGEKERGRVRIPMPTPEEVSTEYYAAPRGYFELARLRGAILEYALRNDLELFGGAEFVRNGHFMWH